MHQYQRGRRAPVARALFSAKTMKTTKVDGASGVSRRRCRRSQYARAFTGVIRRKTNPAIDGGFCGLISRAGDDLLALDFVRDGLRYDLPTGLS